MSGQALSLPLPTIHLTDIGKESNGASIKDVIAEVLKSVSNAAGQAVTGAGDLLGKGLRSTGDAAGKVGGAVGDQATKIGKDIKGLFKKP